MLGPSSDAHYGLQVLIALAHRQRTRLLTEAFLPPLPGHLGSRDRANRLRPARIMLGSSLTSPENRSASWGGSCHSLSCFTAPRLSQDPEAAAQENLPGCFLTRAAFMEIEHLPCSSGSPRAAGTSARLFASTPGASPDVSPRGDRKPQTTETLAKILPGRLRGARQLCPGLRRQTPATQRAAPACRAGRGADPLPAPSNGFVLEPELPAEPRYIIYVRRASTRGSPKGSSSRARWVYARRSHSAKARASCFIAAGFRARPAASAAYGGAVLCRSLARRSRRSSNQVCQRRNIPGPLFPLCLERDHARGRRRLLGAEAVAPGGSGSGRQWLREAARHMLAAAFQPVWRAHPGSPYSHFVDDPDEDAAVLELRQIVEGIGTNFCAVHLEMGRDGQKAEANAALFCATHRLPVLAGDGETGLGVRAKPTLPTTPALPRQKPNAIPTAPQPDGPARVSLITLRCFAQTGRCFARQIQQPLYGPAAAHFPSLLPAPGSAPAPGKFPQLDQAVPAFLVTQQER